MSIVAQTKEFEKKGNYCIVSRSMKILITGGLGFMGSNLIRHLLTKYANYTIWNLDVITYAGNPDNLKDIEERERDLPVHKKRYHFVRGDICDERLLEYLLGEQAFNAVIHLAAETHVDRSIHDTRHFIRTNVGGTHALLDAIRKYPVARFVHISTDEVYGDRADSGHAHEGTTFAPSNPYSASKAAGDLLVQSYVRTYGVPATIVRPSNNFGPYQYPEKLIPLSVSNVLEGKKIPLHGTGEYTRSWLFVGDFCRAVDTLLHGDHNGESYNVSGYQKTNLEIARLIAQRLKKNPDDVIEFVPDRPGQDKSYLLVCDKLKNHHNWVHAHKFEDAMAHTIDWYVSNKPWWQKVRNTPGFQDYYKEQIEGRWF